MTAPGEGRTIDAAFLAEHPLPDPDDDGGKHDRGTVLVVGATAETPGALLLAGLAALRVGAGRLQLAAPEAVAPFLAVQVPEAQVVGLVAHPSGTVGPCDQLTEAMAGADAVLVGCGLGDEGAGRAVLEAAAAAMEGTDGRLVVDAGSLKALGASPDVIARMADRVVATPNPGEGAALAGGEPVDASGVGAASLVERLGCTVALRGSETWVASPSHEPVVERSGPIALGTSGSGDVLAGMVAGHLARGADPFAAVTWAVHLHAAVGRALTEDGPVLGLLARELVDGLPAVRAALPPHLHP